MGNTEINVKKRILEYLTKLDGLDPNITVNELIAEYQRDVEAYDKVVEEGEAELVKEFSNIYLKKYSDDSIFGKELEVFKIRTIEQYCYDTDYKRQYNIKGERLSFNGIHVNLRELTSDASNLMSEKQLRACTVISKELYDGYIQAYRQMKKQFDDIVNEK